MPASSHEKSADYICFVTLAQEIGVEDQGATCKSIRRKLKYHGLPMVDDERIAYLRAVIRSLYGELSQPDGLPHYHRISSEFSDIQDWDLDALYAKYRDAFPAIEEWALPAILRFAVYQFYLR